LPCFLGMRAQISVAGPDEVSPSAMFAGASFHGAVTEFKRRLIEATLTQTGGNRTRAARVLGLQRTYLLRLIREFGVDIPPRVDRRAPGRSTARLR
jgi:DNA-binding NtrC family response regulator